MLATSLARALATRNIHYGWVMVGLAFFYGVCSAAAMSVPGVLLAPIAKDLGWTIGDLSGPLGLRVALFGLVAPFAGGLLLLYGPRKVLTGSAERLASSFGSTATGSLLVSKFREAHLSGSIRGSGDVEAPLDLHHIACDLVTPARH